MDGRLLKRDAARKRRSMRVRKRVRGTLQKPRLSVYRSSSHIYAQIIDDERGHTIAGVSTLSKENKGTVFSKKSKESARHVGQKIAEIAKEKKIKRVVFDRGRYKFHGLIAQLADAARETGLQF